MRKWKAEIWMEDTLQDEDGLLSQDEISRAMEKAKEAIEHVWAGLKVTCLDVHIDKETEQ